MHLSPAPVLIGALLQVESKHQVERKREGVFDANQPSRLSRVVRRNPVVVRVLQCVEIPRVGVQISLGKVHPVRFVAHNLLRIHECSREVPLVRSRDAVWHVALCVFVARTLEHGQDRPCLHVAEVIASHGARVDDRCLGQEDFGDFVELGGLVAAGVEKAPGGIAVRTIRCNVFRGEGLGARSQMKRDVVVPIRGFRTCVRRHVCAAEERQRVALLDCVVQAVRHFVAGGSIDVVGGRRQRQLSIVHLEVPLALPHSPGKQRLLPESPEIVLGIEQ